MELNNKKGEKIISIYWFVILFIIAAAVVYMVLSFYGEPYDIREMEADILTSKVARCLSEAGYLEKKENLKEGCGLNFEVEDAYEWGKQGQYYIEVNFYDFSTKQKVDTLKEGNEQLKENCELEGKGFPVCSERSFYVLDRQKNSYQIDILSIVRKTEKNAQ